MRGRIAAALSTTAVLALTMSACGGGGDEASDTGTRTIKVAYQKTSSFYQLDDLLQEVKPAFEEANPGVTVELEPINGEGDQYFTKLALMNGSEDTAPDVIYEDTFQVMSDAAAGYLLPIDEYVDGWEDWPQFVEAAQEAGKGVDGKTYGVSMGTDTRGIYFNKQIFAKAGLPDDWQPTSWDDIITAAKAVKDKVPGVTPLNVYAGKAGGEQTSMQGFEMLYYGAGDDASLYDSDAKKWLTDSPDFAEALDFYQTIADDELGTPVSQALDGQIGSLIATDLLPKGEVAIAIDGSWLPGGWIEGDNAWKGWEDTIGLAKMPTVDGGGSGFNSMSGGWLLSVGAKTNHPKTAFDFVATALNQENSLTYDTTNSQIAVRKDVASDPDYLSYNPTFEFFSDLVQYTHFRPATPDYSQISANIQTAVESVYTGEASPEDAAETYDEGLSRIVGEQNTTSAG